MGKLDGKIALITGGSEGIGFATAQRFIAEGAEHVFITGRRQEALDKAVQQIKSKNVSGIRADSSSLEDLDKLYDTIKKEKGRLDILFANAGIPDTEFSPVGKITEERFDRVFNINVKGVLFTVQKALPIFTDGGSIILNGSIASVKVLPGASVYCASKAAVRSFARCWTVDLKERNIRVNTISPGSIDTPLLHSLDNAEVFIQNMIKGTVLNRLGTPDEIASAVVFLASSDSSYITGIELFVDGGYAQI